jgi:HlyD family secretion protein
MKNKKILFLSLGVLALLVVFAIVGKKNGWIGNSDAMKVSVEKVSLKDIVESITANGKIQPATEVKISPDVSGEIMELTVKEGDEVKAGQLLIKIKEDIYLSYYDRSVASLDATKANLANSRARKLQVQAQFDQTSKSYERSKTLHRQGAISDAEFESAEASYQISLADVKAGEESVNSALFSVKSAEAAVKEARENLTKTTIYAPMDGTISRLNVEKGERVVGTVQMAGTELLRIANLNAMEVMVEVNENDIIRVSLGDTALIEIDAYLKEKFKGLVVEIANSANTSGMLTDQVTNFEVKIAILPESYQHLIAENKAYPFRPGMSATVDIQTRRVDQVLAVPIQAVTLRADTTDQKDKSKKEDLKEALFVLQDGEAILRFIETGIQDNDFIQIVSGLAADEEVISAPYSAISKTLKDKMKVEVVAEDKLYTK